MQQWQVILTYSTYLGETDDLVDTVVELGESLDEFGAAVGLTSGALSVSLAMEAPDVIAAITESDRSIRQAADKHGIGDIGDIASSDVVTWERAERELEQPNYPDIVSPVEAADILGVSRQRVHELRRTREDFPAPLYELRTGPLWVRAGIVRFAERWERKPGRPRHLAHS